MERAAENCMFGAFTLGNAAGRYLTAAGFGAWESYRARLAIAFVALVVAVLARFALGRYRNVATAPRRIRLQSRGAVLARTSSARAAAYL